MITEGLSFMKGLVLGVILCVGITFLVDIKKGPLSKIIQHKDSHLLSASYLQNFAELPIHKQTELRQRVRVYCIIFVTPKELEQWAAVEQTWSKHCDKAEFYSSEDVKAFKTINLETADKWKMILRACMLAYQNYINEYNWFLIVNHNTFVIIENLKYFLFDKNPEHPYYIGKSLKHGSDNYIDSRGGIVLSKEALRRFITSLDRCLENYKSVGHLSPDVVFALCLKYKRVLATNAEDNKGRMLFNTNIVNNLINEAMSTHPQNVLNGCCADTAITFHGLSPNQMHIMMYGVYRLHAYGYYHLDGELVFLPPDDSDLK
ncbi:C1GALT1-specific chaperone 1-like isoform X2 [Protopterus annectens]|nr:C1GALT1-specific chaperone 1-like isoform X2 [Protopterus annectens]XP_043913268.1 C1GALT1-specific chaperone 1-like isoform X2 [Protopterus annectens]